MFIDERKVPTRLRGMHDGRQTAVWRIEGSRWYDVVAARRTAVPPGSPTRCVCCRRALRVTAEGDRW